MMSEIFLKIVNMSLNASWLVAAVILLRVLFKKTPRWITCLFWGLVGLRLLLPAFPTSPFSLLPGTEIRVGSAEEAQLQTGNSMEYTGDEASVIRDDEVSYMQASSEPASEPALGPLQLFLKTSGIIWAAGVVIMMIYMAVSFIRLKRSVRLSAKGPAGVMECDEIDSPFILGVIHPVVYVPSGLDRETFDLVLAHEKAHIARLDYLWKPFGFLLLSVYWFNPVMWVAYILLCRDIETACDEKVIKNKDRDYMAAYSTALLNCSIRRRTVAACPLAFGETGVKMRVKNILNYKKPAFWIVIAGLCACVVLTVCFLTGPSEKEPVSDADNVTRSVKPASDPAEDPVYTEPPVLMVITDSGEVEAAKGTYSWNYETEDGQVHGAVADCPHPLSTAWQKPVIQYSDVSDREVYLEFETEPVEVYIRGWDDRVAGDGEIDDAEVIRLSYTSEGSSFTIPDMPGSTGIIIEVTGRWETGTASYVFEIKGDGSDSINADDRAGETGTILLWPVESRVITRKFSEEHPMTDIAGNVGYPVQAVTDGIIEDAGFSEEDGNYIVLSASGITVTYRHLDSCSVNKGDNVSAGTVIGALGNTGMSTGPHLCIEVKVNGEYADFFTMTE